MATPQDIEKLVSERLKEIIKEKGAPQEIDEAFGKELFEGIPTTLATEESGGDMPPIVPMQIIFGPVIVRPPIPIATPPPPPIAPLHQVQLPSMSLQFSTNDPAVLLTAPLLGIGEPSGTLQGAATCYLHTFKEYPDYTLFQIENADGKGYLRAFFYDKVVRPHERNDGQWTVMPTNAETESSVKAKASRLK